MRSSSKRLFSLAATIVPFAIRYNFFGSTNIYPMTEGEMLHDLGAVASDSQTGKLLWTYRERVRIKRIR
jgi:hypothetical protein